MTPLCAALFQVLRFAEECRGSDRCTAEYKRAWGRFKKAFDTAKSAWSDVDRDMRRHAKSSAVPYMEVSAAVPEALRLLSEIAISQTPRRGGWRQMTAEQVIRATELCREIDGMRKARLNATLGLVQRAETLLQSLEHSEDTQTNKHPPTPGLTISADSRTAIWNGQRLSINAHVQFDLLQVLDQHRGAIVSHRALLKAIKPGAISDTIAELKEADAEVKRAMTAIRDAFQAAGCPATITAVKSKGYRLELPDE